MYKTLAIEHLILTLSIVSFIFWADVALLCHMQKIGTFNLRTRFHVPTGGCYRIAICAGAKGYGIKTKQAAPIKRRPAFITLFQLRQRETAR